MTDTVAHAIEVLLRIMTAEQVQHLVAVIIQAQQDGYGEVTITFENGNPRFIRVVKSDRL